MPKICFHFQQLITHSIELWVMKTENENLAKHGS